MFFHEAEMKLFKPIPTAPEDSILGLARLVAQDKRPEKVNLGIGTYLDAAGAPCLLPSVAEAEKVVVERKLPKEYLPIEGNPEFLEAVQAHLLGCLPKQNYCRLQTVGGAAALRVAGEFLVRYFSSSIVIPTPTWANHEGIFTHARLTVASYPYYDLQSQAICFEAMLAFIAAMPSPATIVLQLNGHNPTGADLNLAQWQELALLIKKKGHFPLFDNAYQGFVRGVEEDILPLHVFIKEGIEFAVAVSLSKNFGLYGERVGALYWHLEDKEKQQAMLSQLRVLTRTFYSNPPRHGAAIAAQILKEAASRSLWLSELSAMKHRIHSTRCLLVEALVARPRGEKYAYLKERGGFFSMLNLSKEAILRLREEKGIYMLSNGRINIAGLTEKDIEYVAEALSLEGVQKT